MSPQAPYVSVVIPSYRGVASIDRVVKEVEQSLSGAGLSHEILVVDDRSPDETWERLAQITDSNPSVTAIRLQRNVGQMAATLCGIAHSSGTVVVTMDDDLQHPPDQVPILVAALDKNPEWDVVVGAWDRGNDGPFRTFGSKVFGFLQDLAVPEGRGLRHTGFRAMRRSTADALAEHGTRHPVLTSLIFEVAGSVENVDVSHRPREQGMSGFSFSSAVRIAVDNFVQTSTLPLRWIALFGFTVSILAVLVALIYLVRAMLGADTPPGWTSTFLGVVFFGGAVLGTLGLIGRYLAVIMTEARRPPRWVVREQRSATLDATVESSD